jgi:predicted polyphosphate/ATP-dependent NAD kinase
MSKVGIIANPASGKDIRRLVAYASIMDNNEKTNQLRRLIMGIDAAGVDEILIMPD